MNQLIEDEPVQPVRPQVKSSTPGPINKAAEFDFFITRENVQKLTPLFLLLLGTAIFYIANAHYSERVIRQMDKMDKEIKELRSEYITIKSDLMFRSKQSEVARRLEAKGIKELSTPPRKISTEE